MILPYPKHLDVTEVQIELQDGYNSDGTPKVIQIYTGKCRLVESSKYIRNADGKLIQLIGKIYIGEDIAPNLKVINGLVTINGNIYQINSCSRPRNPDGSVHHTKLELI